MKIKLNSYHFQSLVLLMSNIVLLFISFFTNILMSKNISPSIYGQYRYIINYLLMVPGLINLGYVNTAGRLSAVSEKNGYGEIRNSAWTISVVLSLLYIVISIMYFGFRYIYIKDKVILELGYFTPAVIIFSLQLFLISILRGENKIKALSGIKFIPTLCIFISLIVQILVLKIIDVKIMLISYIFFNFLTIIYFFKVMKVSFSSPLKAFKFMKKEHLSFGIKIYIGSIFGVVISQVIGLTSRTLIGAEEYGYFSLALSFIIPFQMLTATLGNIMYKSNVKREKISVMLLSFIFLLNIVGYLIFIYLLENYFILIFSLKYIYSIYYIKYLSLYGCLLGIGDFFNRFLGAKGYGGKLMTSAILTGLSMLICYLTLIPTYKIKGLLLSYIISGFVYFLTQIYFYIKYLIQLRSVKMKSILLKEEMRK